MLLIERTLSSRVAKDFDIQIMKRALLVFGMASITVQVSLNKAAEIPQAEAAPDRQLDQKPIPSIRANKEHRLPNRERKIRRGRRLRTRFQLKAAATQRAPPRLPVRRQTESDLARQAKMGCDQRLRAFPPEFVQQPLRERARA
jgi:hypothetical protein